MNCCALVLRHTILDSRILISCMNILSALLFMTACNVSIRNCVATSAALGLPIAVAGTIGFVVAGMAQSGLPSHTIGYVYVPALLVIVAASVIFAPLGARAAHRWPVKALKRSFAVVLYVLAAYMLAKSFQTWPR